MLKWEHQCYQNPAIRASQRLRAFYDAINVHESSVPESSYCLAFEWMDCTLKDLTSEAHRRNLVLHKSISKAVLEALDVLKSQHLVHTGIYYNCCRSIAEVTGKSDIKDDNILISGIDEPSPTVKLGDLGLGCCLFLVASHCADAVQYA